ncbi:MAG: VWA domain-containing protein, partial [Terriglobales bacterium]
RRVCVVALILLSLGWAQTPQREVRVSGGAYRLPPPRFSAQSDLVEVEVVVRDAKGEPIAGLQLPDFRLTDNGHARQLSAFSVSTAPGPAALKPGPHPNPAAAAATAPAAVMPRALELFFDDVNTGKNDLGNARNAALRFAREALTPADRVAIYTASTDGELGFTRDRGKLNAAIAAIAPHPRQSKYGLDGVCPRMTPYQAYLIANHLDPAALAAAMAEKLECDQRIGIVDDGTSGYTGGHVAGGIAGSDNDSEQVVAQAIGEWDQARGVSQDAQAAILAGIEDLARQPGSRVLLLASDGFISEGTALEQQQEHIVSAALRANIVMDALDAQGLFSSGPGRSLSDQDDMGVLPLAGYIFDETRKLPQQQEARQAMANFAQSTGGLFFHDNNDLTLGFERLGMVPEVTYHLAFSAGDVLHDGKFHPLKVELAPHVSGADQGTDHGTDHGTIQARPGYFAPLPDDSVASLRTQMDDAMRSSSSQPEAGLEIQAQAGAGRERVSFGFDLRQIPFISKRGHHIQDLYFIAGLFDAQGQFVTGKQGEMDLELQDATWKRMLAEGLNANLSLAAPPGSYRLRVVVAEFSDGKIAAASYPATLR